MDTILYLIKPSEVIPKGNFSIIENKEGNPSLFENSILSVQGEEKAMRLSKLEVLQNLDAVYASNQANAIGTAKYLASSNHTIIQLDSRLNERRIGKTEEVDLKDFYRRQAKDWDYKFAKGESLNEAKKRIVSAIKNILMFETGNKVAVISHNTIITCLLSAWCQIGYNLDDEVILSYKDETLVDGYQNIPMILEVIFDGMNVKSIRMLDFN